MKRIFILAFCLLFLACTASSGQPDLEEPSSDSSLPADTVETADTSKEDSPQKTAKDNFPFSTTDLDGNPYNQDLFSEYDLVMLNFWAYWCGPCISELPDLEQIHQNYPNVLLLGVSVDNSDTDLVRSAVESTGITYPVLYPAGGLAYLSDKCQYIPTTYFLSPAGEILAEPIVGSNDYSVWASIIESYLQ